MNKETRKEALERDAHECQLSKQFGIAELSGVECVEEKEVHHKTYERYNEEEPDDLIVVCRRCHDFLTSYIRGLRYSIRNGDLKLGDVVTASSVVTQEKTRNEDVELQNYGSRATNPAQRIVGRSIIRGNNLDLKDFKEASEDRIGLGGDGEA